MKILGLSGKKQSGKSSAAKFIMGFEMCALGILTKREGNALGFDMDDDGNIVIEELWGDKEYAGIFDPERNNQIMRNWLEQHVNPFYKMYSLADLLKQHVCINILGLSYDQCYGTNEQKNELTNLKWENMPGVLTDDSLIAKAQTSASSVKRVVDAAGLILHAPGFMSGREVMQYVGSNVFRRMYPTVWVDATIKRILAENSAFAVITDVRFPDEVEGIQNAGGKVLRLTRNTLDDRHISEIALDPDKFDQSKFDAVVDNQNISLAEKNKIVLETLYEWGFYHVDLTSVTETENKVKRAERTHQAVRR